MKELSNEMAFERDKSPESTAVIDQPLKHPLEHKWTFWFYENIKGKDWLDNLHQVYTFDTVEDFWCLFNNIKQASDLVIGSDYAVFKEGIQPMWEDEKNKNGGKWLVNIDANKNISSDIWLTLLLYIIGESFDEYSEEIHGAYFNRRAKFDKIGLWISDIDRKDQIMEIGHKLKDCLQKNDYLPFSYDSRISFEKHSDSQKKSSRGSFLYQI